MDAAVFYLDLGFIRSDFLVDEVVRVVAWCLLLDLRMLLGLIYPQRLVDPLWLVFFSELISGIFQFIRRKIQLFIFGKGLVGFLLFVSRVTVIVLMSSFRGRQGEIQLQTLLLTWIVLYRSITNFIELGQIELMRVLLVILVRILIIFMLTQLVRLII
jgi:hypothetical protein